MDGIPTTFSWFERTHLAQCANFRSKSMCCREIGVIESVFAPIIAADVTLSTQAAGITGATVYIWMLFANWFARHWRFALVAKSKRASTESARDDRIDALKRPDVEHSVQTVAGIPEISLHPVGTARK